MSSIYHAPLCLAEEHLQACFEEMMGALRMQRKYHL